ncbi:outer membrane lipoprotein-sorting protein [Methanohalophilus levihalophilus]|uniref:DUF4367 domain-containing protein n=1 Tax=Methanohalophilus levihalophilus TaxID=1431282 RepID=UPI001AE108EA|nr:DUF4367 domain-containing protein [Methanohalophilus levihalophilus]MBP2030232.1 outer membrane lipoprotein-sorting protein [Methanohalophilus levihalophilus]
MNIQNLTLILLITAVLLFSAGCVGEDSTAEQIAEEYEQRQSEIEDYSATVHVTASTATQEMVSVSEIIYKNPGKVRETIKEFSYTEKEPEQLSADTFTFFYNSWQNEGSVVASNGETMWIFDQGQNAVIVGEADPMAIYYGYRVDSFELVELLIDENDFTLEGTSSIDGRETYVIHGSPKDDYPIEMKAWIDTETWMPLRFEMHGTESSFDTIIEYRDLELNTGIPDSEFEFEIPEGVEVIAFDEYVNAAPQGPTIDEAQELIENDIQVPSYIPEGFEFYSASADTFSSGSIQEITFLRYSNGSAFISIHEQFFENEIGFEIEYEGAEVDINGATGKLKVDEEDGSVSLFWVDGNAMIIISGQIGSDEILKIARSME